MNNPMYEAQLNQHEEQIRDIDGRLHSYDLGLRWCEEQIKKLAGEDYSPCVVIDNPIEKEYDKLKNDHNLLKEEYTVLNDQHEKEKEKCHYIQEANEEKGRRIDALYKELAQKIIEINKLKQEIEKWKEACLRHQVDVNNFQGAYTEATEKVKVLNENIEHLERENEHLRELYSCTVESSKKIIDKLRKENKE